MKNISVNVGSVRKIGLPVQPDSRIRTLINVNNKQFDIYNNSVWYTYAKRVKIFANAIEHHNYI